MERRVYERMAVLVNCVLFDNNRAIEHNGVLEDICEGGVGFIIYDRTPPNLGDVCTIQFVGNSEYSSSDFVVVEPVVINSVIHVEDGCRIGAKFITDLSEESLGYIRLLSAQLLLNNTAE